MSVHYFDITFGTLGQLSSEIDMSKFLQVYTFTFLQFVH